jgi:hypothetical protein
MPMYPLPVSRSAQKLIVTFNNQGVVQSVMSFSAGNGYNT